MSKMGEELDRKLDEAKYDLYEACKQALIHSEIPTDAIPLHVIKQLEQALAKVEGNEKPTD